MKKTLLSFFAILAFASFVNAQVPVRTGWWKFDDAADMVKAQIGSPLVLTGTQSSVPGPVAGNLATQVPLGSYLTMTHGIAPNGGGDSVNEYSIQIDFSVPEIGKWHSFIQTNPSNSGGGSMGDADLFTNTSNKIGTSATGYSTNSITVDTWYRMIISVKNGEFFRVYINGELWLEKTLLPVDGRWALVNELLLFADDDGDDAAINCAEIGIWDVALNVAQALELGNASTVPIPVRKGWWKFDDAADMLKAETGSPLALTGTQMSVPGPEEVNLATQIGLASYLTMTHGIAPNGAGDSVNEYSVQIDFSVPEIGKWHSFIQTNPSNSGGGSKGDADLFTNTSNKIGTSATGYSTNSITVDTWYRMIISVKNGEFFRVYINGELWLEGTPQAIDGRWALVNELLVFADDDGDDATINCAEVGIWDVALSAAEVLQLGGFASNVLVSGITVTAAGNATTIETQGGTLQMSAAIVPVNATDQTVTWSVTNGTGQASISVDGLLTALKDGTVTVNATSKDGGNVSGSLVITISNQPVILVSGVSVTAAGNATTIETRGGTLQMSAAVLPVDATDMTVTWSVTNGTGEASISATGLLSAIKDGVVTVNATSNDGGNVVGRLEITISNQASDRLRKGWWKFDDAADLLKAEIGSPLTLTGTQTSVSGPVTGNLATQVPLGSYLAMAHGIAPNGGGTLVNEWSLQIDFSVEQLAKWYAFFETDKITSGDADLFVAKSANSGTGAVPNSIGSGSTKYTANTISANTWYRMVVSVKNGEFFRIYIDGVLWLDSPVIQAVDGRYGLAPEIFLFQDGDGDDGTINCSEAGIWDVALTAAEVLKLGGVYTMEDFNIIKNGSFATDGPIVSPWAFWSGNGGTASVTGGVCVMVPGAASNSWQLQVNQTGNDVGWSVANDDSYVFMFDAKATGARAFNIDFEDPNNGYKRFGLSSNADAVKGESEWFVDLTTDMTTYTRDVTFNAVKSNTKFLLNIMPGSAIEAVHIDNIMLIKASNIKYFGKLVTGLSVKGEGNATTIAIAGGTLQMLAEVLPADATLKGVTWSVADGTGSATINSQGLLTAVLKGTVTVTATAKDGSGISGSMEVTIDQTVGLSDRSAFDVKLYPNPAENELYISGKPTLSKVAVYTVLGAQVKEYSNVLQSIDVSDLDTGIYIIRLTDTTGKTVTSKFIKK